MSTHKDAEYYINAKGEHVMSYSVFQAMSVHKVLSTLGVKPKAKKGKTKKQRKQTEGEEKS